VSANRDKSCSGASAFVGVAVVISVVHCASTILAYFKRSGFATITIALVEGRGIEFAVGVEG
jgi:hypothetical protein